MHRTDGPNNSSGMFVDKVPGVSPGTIVEEAWLNAVQEEIAQVIEGAGASLAASGAADTSKNQLLLALQSLLGQQNLVINGRFDLWQRNTTRTQSSSARAYTADRWYSHTSAGTNSLTISRSTDCPTGARYSCKVQRPALNVATGTRNLTQEIDRDYVRMMRGRVCKLSFWAKRGADYSAAGNALDVAIITGTGAETQTNHGGYTGSASLLSMPVTLTTSWQQFTVSVPAAGASVTTAALVFADTCVGTAGAEDAFFVCGVQLCDSASSSRGFEGVYRYAGGSFAGEVALCQRYYEKSYDLDTVPATNTYDNEANVVLAANTDPGSIEFKVPKRIVPALTFWQKDGSNANWTCDTGTTGINPLNPGQNRFTPDVTGSPNIPSASTRIHGHWAADAEL